MNHRVYIRICKDCFGDLIWVFIYTHFMLLIIKMPVMQRTYGPHHHMNEEESSENFKPHSFAGPCQER